MSKKLAILAFVFLALLTNANFAQETFTNDAAKVSVTLPAGWHYDSSDMGMLAYPKEGGFAIHFGVLHVDDLTAALTEVDKMLSHQVSHLKLGAAKKYDVNGMHAVFVEGTADGVLIAVGVVDTPAEGSSMMVSAFGAPETVKKYAADILSIVGSMKPAH